MQRLTQLLQVIVALGLLNVWLLRFLQASAYRGGSAHNMRQEFAAYGLPPWSLYAVGALKIGAAAALLAGLWFPVLVAPAALLLCALMLSAVGMHLKIHDPLKKSAPALAMFAACLTISIVVLS
jgi:uncharacterized membrane protein YphA (DoxX/SURF4 family)